jgi:hypothetical protein
VLSHSFLTFLASKTRCGIQSGIQRRIDPKSTPPP